MYFYVLFQDLTICILDFFKYFSFFNKLIHYRREVKFNFSVKLFIFLLTNAFFYTQPRRIQFVYIFIHKLHLFLPQNGFNSFFKFFAFIDFC